MGNAARFGARAGKTAFALVVAVLLSEATLRILFPFQIVYQTWMPRGIHQPDERFGIVYTPDFSGRMFHTDGVNGVPFSLDEFGLRKAVASAAVGEPERVVLIGGASNVFGYGVADADTIASRIAANLPRPTEVRATAWAGLDVHLNFHMYRERIEAQVDPDVAIMCFALESPEYILRLDEDFDASPDDAPDDELFGEFEDFGRIPTTPTAEAFGSLYYRFYVVAQSVRLLESFYEVYEKYFVYGEAIVFPKQRQKREIVFGESQIRKREEKKELLQTEDLPPHIQKFVDLLGYYRDYFEERGVRFHAVLLPNIYGRPNPFLESLKFSLPRDFPCLDLQTYEYMARFTIDDYLAHGHYGVAMTRALGKDIARGVWGDASPTIEGL